MQASVVLIFVTVMAIVGGLYFHIQDKKEAQHQLPVNQD